MEIHGLGGVSGPNRLEPQRAVAPSGNSAPKATSVGDRVEISEHAHWLEQLSCVPDVRQEKIDELRGIIESGKFETPERIAGAVEKLMQEL